MSKQSCNFEIDDENSNCFDKGKFDNFCVYFKTYNKNKILIEKIITLEEEAHTLNTLLKLWKGTAP